MEKDRKVSGRNAADGNTVYTSFFSTEFRNFLKDIVCPVFEAASDDMPSLFAVPSFRVWCVAHLVQTVAKVATDAKADIVSQIRAMVTFIHRATTAEEYMTFAGVENLCLPLDVATRWNSLLHMIEAAFKQRDNITSFVSTKKGEILRGRLADEEWVEIDNLIELLKPLGQVTVKCSAYKVRPFFTKTVVAIRTWDCS